ncbi:MAG: hypothetical protein RM347_011455 [Nostoc sp. ChiQUE02]|uniref:hypothetical protein n=1 Tax=Nostoc sp. ChiQUE02 TaxID=3075377 RepID=UPI002AD45B80|nr:hypothetical protein [Nostoc sp. ChiQUE02]MDZ8235057.1 hypothetical protein [Nostoc sp. ChiQUE02]
MFAYYEWGVGKVVKDGFNHRWHNLTRSITNSVCSTCPSVFQDKLKVESEGVGAIALGQWFQNRDRCES